MTPGIPKIVSALPFGIEKKLKIGGGGQRRWEMSKKGLLLLCYSRVGHLHVRLRDGGRQAHFGERFRESNERLQLARVGRNESRLLALLAHELVLVGQQLHRLVSELRLHILFCVRNVIPAK